MGGDTLVLQAVLLVARKLVLREAGIIHGMSGRDVEAWAKRKARLLARSLTPEEKAVVGADPGSWPERIGAAEVRNVLLAGEAPRGPLALPPPPEPAPPPPEETPEGMAE